MTCCLNASLQNQILMESPAAVSLPISWARAEERSRLRWAPTMHTRTKLPNLYLKVFAHRLKLPLSLASMRPHFSRRPGAIPCDPASSGEHLPSQSRPASSSRRTRLRGKSNSPVGLNPEIGHAAPIHAGYHTRHRCGFHGLLVRGKVSGTHATLGTDCHNSNIKRNTQWPCTGDGK
jgi:hypothetical protein